MRIVGVSGTNGAGKDTLAQLLVERYGFVFVSVSDLLRDEARRRGLPVEREVLGMISAQWRREHGMGVLVDRAIERFTAPHTGVVIASIRNPGEADRIHELGGSVIWVDAPARVRYERIRARQRAGTDAKTFAAFLEEESAEREHSGDEATLSLDAVKARADIFVENAGDRGSFTDAVDRAVRSCFADAVRTASDRG
jgi:dephospho-CoA kinase